jgi:hypothetical protein
MSHIATVEVQIKDLDCLAKAAERCGLEFKKDQKNFRWYGRWMNDYDEDDDSGCETPTSVLDTPFN